MSTLLQLEVSSPRGLVRRAEVFTETPAAGSNTALHTTRELTTAEALADVETFGNYNYSKHCKLSFAPNTTKKNKSFVKAFKAITGTEIVTVDTCRTFLNVILHKQRHKLAYGLPKVITRKSFVDNWCRLLPRLWRTQNANVHVPGEIQYVCQEFQRSGNACLPASKRTMSFCDDCALLLISALPKGSSKFFETSFLICVVLRVGRRINMFSRLSFGSLKTIRDLTADADRGDPKKHVWMVVAELRCMKGDLGQDEVYDTVLVGCPHFLGITDEVYYLNQTCIHRLGVPLLDVVSGLTIEDQLLLPAYSAMKNRKVYRPVAVDLYKVFHEIFEKNTDVPIEISRDLRPHGARTFVSETYQRAHEKGEISEAVMLQVQHNLGHSGFGSVHHDNYLSKPYHRSLYFGGFSTANPAIRGLFHVPRESLSVKLGYKNGALPQLLSFPFTENVDVVEDVVTEILGKHLIAVGRTLTAKALKLYRFGRLHAMKMAYAKAKLGVMWKAVALTEVYKYFTKEVAGRFATMSRQEMIEYTTTHIVPYLKL